MTSVAPTRSQPVSEALYDPVFWVHHIVTH